MKHLHLAILTAVCCIFVSCGQRKLERSANDKDSLYTLDYIRTIIMTDPAQALHLLDTAESMKLLPQ